MYLMDFSWKHYPNATYFYDDVIIAETGAAISLSGWLMGFVILLIRCIAHADFLVVERHPFTTSNPVQTGSPSTVLTSVNSSSSSQATTPEKNIEAEPLMLVTTANCRASVGPGTKTNLSS
ncbi:unnamed protein product [Allacma fusca]|uniref:Uncharacterized protein n=1 Tax=Allacma fusca TaxID=39272 RepID=A0A8J2P1B2_9HEXA|nr:unnamed protein product [Allacma fusca]